MAQTLIFIFCPLYSLSFYSLQFLPCRVSLGSTNGKRFCLWVHDRHCGEGRLPLNALNLCVQYYRLSAKSAKTDAPLNDGLNIRRLKLVYVKSILYNLLALSFKICLYQTETSKL